MMWGKPEASTSAKTKQVRALQTVDEMKDPRTKLQQKGFLFKSMIEMKIDKDDAVASEAYKGKVFEIQTITSETVTAVEYTRFSDEKKQTVAIPIDDIIVTPKWKLYKGKVAAPLPGINDDSNPANSKNWSVDAVSGVITASLRSCFLNNESSHDKITIYQHPNSVLANDDIKANELVLVPATTKVDRTSAFNKILVGSFSVAGSTTDNKFYLAPHISLPFDKDGNRVENSWIAPFWFVRTTADNSKVNCQIKHEQYKVLDMTINIPVLKNTKKIKKHEEPGICRV
jgi:hypothetical protein